MIASGDSFLVRQSRGLTLVEVLTTISILAVSLSLLIPAVMSSQQASLRMRCVSQLKQIELATLSYHETFTAFPAYTHLEFSGSPREVTKFYSVFSRITPYFEQVDIYNQINFDVELHDELVTKVSPLSSKSFDYHADFTVMSTNLKILNCPSDPSPSDQPDTKGTNYRPNYGTRPDYGSNLSLAGPFSYRDLLSASGVTDGLSHTVAYSEKPRGDSHRVEFNPFVDSLVDPQHPDPPEVIPFQYCASQPIIPANFRTATGFNWLIGGLTQTCYNHMERPNGPQPDCIHLGFAPGRARATARSYHGGGVNVAMADGSVRFVTGSVNSRVWQGLGTRAGGEVHSDDDW